MILYHGSKEIVRFPEVRKATFNKDFYFQSRDYIAECYKAGEILE